MDSIEGLRRGEREDISRTRSAGRGMSGSSRGCVVVLADAIDPIPGREAFDHRVTHPLPISLSVIMFYD